MKNDSTIPPRTQKTTDLVVSIAMLGKELTEENKTDPDYANPVLAFCEIAVSLPIEWFTNEERLMVVGLIDNLYPRGFQSFMQDITMGDISFYNKMIGDTGLQDHEHSNLALVVAKMKAMHDYQFGGKI